jgi:hypothetical protein
LLLTAARDRRPRVSGLSFALVLLVVIGIASEFARLPAFISMVEGGNYYRSKWSSDGRTIQLEMAGDVRFGEDDVSVVHMSPNAFVRLEERLGWSGRRVVIQNGGSADIQLRYFVHGTERPLDASGRAWLASILPRMIRDSGINAEERASRILQQKGPVALFQEIDRISGDHSRRRYLLTAVNSGTLQTDDIRRAFRSASRISSDHEKATFLAEVTAEGLTQELRAYFFEAVDSISSDHERRRIISKAIADSRGDLDVMALAARSVERINGDHEKAEALKQIDMESLLHESPTRQAVLRAAASIQSDHEKSGVLARILQSRSVEPELAAEILRVAEGIQSDHDKSRLLERVENELVTTGPARTPFFAAVRTIQSDSDRARVLTEFLRRGNHSAESLEEVCRAAQGISADNEKANVLTAVRSSLPSACFTAVRTISSDHDKRRVIERVLLSGAEPEIARAAVEAASTLSSDHDKAEVLICAAGRYPDDVTRELIRKVATGVSSDSDYRRVISKLPERKP